MVSGNCRVTSFSKVDYEETGKPGHPVSIKLHVYGKGLTPSIFFGNYLVGLSEILAKNPKITFSL